jgi:hypothetical protein
MALALVSPWPPGQALISPSPPGASRAQIARALFTLMPMLFINRMCRRHLHLMAWA